jgi:hypothetical protein
MPAVFTADAPSMKSSLVHLHLTSIASTTSTPPKAEGERLQDKTGSTTATVETTTTNNTKEDQQQQQAVLRLEK